MKWSLIVAVSENGVIGKDGDLPWRIPADLKWFKKTTMGKPILMGRKTYDSIGRALPGRTNMVLTRNPDFKAKGCLVVRSFDEAATAAGPVDEMMVMGGSSLYEEALPKADRIYFTRVHAEVEGDACFPEFDLSEWRETFCEHHERDGETPMAFTFFIYDRK